MSSMPSPLKSPPYVQPVPPHKAGVVHVVFVKPLPVLSFM